MSVRVVSEVERVNLWSIVKPADDMPDQWVALCVQWNLMAQAPSFKEALDCLGAVMRAAIDDDLKHGLDPLKRKGADPKYQEMLTFIQMHGKTVRHDDLFKTASRTKCYAAIQLEAVYPSTNSKPKVRPIQPTWRVSKLAA
jgi:hypothetical protein